MRDGVVDVGDVLCVIDKKLAPIRSAEWETFLHYAFLKFFFFFPLFQRTILTVEFHVLPLRRSRAQPHARAARRGRRPAHAADTGRRPLGRRVCARTRWPHVARPARARAPAHSRAADMPGGRQPQKGVGRAGGTRPGEAVEDAAGRRGVKEGHWRAHDLRAQPGAVSWAGAWRRCRPRRERSAADCADRQRAAGSAARLPGPVFRGGQPAWILPVCDAPPHVSLHGHIAAHLLG